MGWFQSRADVLAMKATVDSTDFFPDLGHFILELPLGGKSFFSSSILLHILRKKSLFIYLFKKNCVCVCVKQTKVNLFKSAHFFCIKTLDYVCVSDLFHTKVLRKASLS